MVIVVLQSMTLAHHKLNIHWAADVIQSNHGALSFYFPTEEQLVRTSIPAVKSGAHVSGPDLHIQACTVLFSCHKVRGQQA